MDNKLQIFSNEQFGQVRTAEFNNKIYFCGKDVATALGYSDTAKAIRSHCKGVDEIATPTKKTHTYWTQKGRLFLYDLFKRDGILPLIEKISA